MIQEKLQLVQKIILHILPEKAVPVSLMSLDFRLLQLAVPEKLRSELPNGIGGAGSDARNVFDDHGIRSDHFGNALPVGLRIPVLYPVYLGKNHWNADGIPGSGKIRPVLKLLIPEHRNFLVHGLEHHRGRLAVLLTAIDPGVLIHHLIEIPFRMVGRRARPETAAFRRKFINLQRILVIDLVKEPIL